MLATFTEECNRSFLKMYSYLLYSWKLIVARSTELRSPRIVTVGVVRLLLAANGRGEEQLTWSAYCNIKGHISLVLPGNR